jgi:hypothetical protein
MQRERRIRKVEGIKYQDIIERISKCRLFKMSTITYYNYSCLTARALVALAVDMLFPSNRYFTVTLDTFCLTFSDLLIFFQNLYSGCNGKKAYIRTRTSPG